jgi:hypothetical protein
VLRGGSYLDSADGAFNHLVVASVRMGNTEDSSADNMGACRCRHASTTTTTFDTTDSSTTSPGFRCAKSVASEGPSGVKPHGYRYDNVKKKRPPPGVGDPIKDGGKGAEEMVQAIAAEQGAEGLQKWMDKFGMGGEVRRYCELRAPRVPHASQPKPALSPPTSLISSRQVMMAKDAMRKREKAAEKRREAEEAWIKDEIDAHSFDDLKDEDIDKTEL